MIIGWADGKLSGKYTEWFESGQEKIEGEYKDGQVWQYEQV